MSYDLINNGISFDNIQVSTDGTNYFSIDNCEIKEFDKDYVKLDKKVKEDFTITGTLDLSEEAMEFFNKIRLQGLKEIQYAELMLHYLICKHDSLTKGLKEFSKIFPDCSFEKGSPLDQIHSEVLL